MPTIEEVCNTFGLTDVDLKFTDSDYQNLTTYKLFQQHVRPLLAKENPKVRLFTYFCERPFTVFLSLKVTLKFLTTMLCFRFLCQS